MKWIPRCKSCHLLDFLQLNYYDSNNNYPTPPPRGHSFQGQTTSQKSEGKSEIGKLTMPITELCNPCGKNLRIFCEYLRILTEPRLAWLSWLGIVLQGERLPVWFPVRAHVRVAGSVPGWAACERQTFSHIDVSLSLFLPPSPFSLLRKKRILTDRVNTEQQIDKRHRIQFIIQPPNNTFNLKSN